MPAVGNAYTKTSSIGKENLCVIYLSVDLSSYTALVGENMDINIGVGKIAKRDIFKSELVPAENGCHDKQRKKRNETVLQFLHAQLHEQRLMCFHL